jgi:uncharacterized protein (DUF1499 family)
MWKRLVQIAFAVALLAVLGFIGLMVVLGVMSRTPPDNLGVKDGKLAACPDTPNCVSSQADDPVHHAEPFRFGGPGQPQYTPSFAWGRLVSVVSGMPRANVVDPDAIYLRAEFSSAIFRFVDDVEFVLDEQDNVIHFRSASRVGRSDMGANRARIEAIRAAWEKGG